MADDLDQQRLVSCFREMLVSIIDLLDVHQQFDDGFSSLTRAEAVAASFILLYPTLSVDAFIGEMDTTTFLLKQQVIQEREG